MPIISIAQRNRAPTAEDARHDVHAFDVDEDHPLQPLLFTQSVGGGFAERGGACRRGVHELEDNAFWREALALAGCGWVIGVLEASMGQGIDQGVDGDIARRNAKAVHAILVARAANTVCLQRSRIEPDAGRKPMYAGPHVEDADCSIRCEDCTDWVPLPFDRILGDSEAWLHGLSDIEWSRVQSAFVCRTDIGPSGHARMLSHDAGMPGFGLVSCEGCAQRYAAYVTCEEAQPGLYLLRLQGLARVVPDAPDAPSPAVTAPPPASFASPAPAEVASAPEPVTPGWWSAPGEPPLYYVSVSNKPGAIACEIAIVHAKMQERRAADHAERGNALYLQSDGTQSKLRMYWVDRSKGGAVGDYDYTLVLRDAEFADADVFETTCRHAVGFFVRKHAPEHLRVFFHREFDPYGRRVHAPRQMSSGR